LSAAPRCPRLLYLSRLEPDLLPLLVGTLTRLGCMRFSKRRPALITYGVLVAAFIEEVPYRLIIMCRGLVPTEVMSRTHLS